MTTPVTEEHESSDGAEYGHDGPLDFPTGAAEQPRGYGPMDLPTSAAAEVQAGVAGVPAGASSEGVLDFTSALAKEGMVPETTSNSDAGAATRAPARHGAKHWPGRARRRGNLCVIIHCLFNGPCLLLCIVRMNAS